jgi:outer membrane protein assembly factor BamB
MRPLALLIASLLPLAHAADWPEFLGPNRNNTSPETGLRQSLSPDGVPILWKKSIGTGYSAPSIRANRLVLHHRSGPEEIVECLNPTTGEALWKYAYPSRFVDPFGYNNGPRCSPLLTDSHCYTYGAEGVLLCLDLASGKRVWQRNTLSEFNVPEAFFGVGSTPILENGKLIVMIGGQPNSAIAALDPATGKTLWENGGEKTWNGAPMIGWPGERTIQWNPNDPAFEKQASYCSPVAATLHGKRHLLCVTRQGLISLNPEDGSCNFVFWFRARQDSSVNAMTPVVHDNTILLSSAYFKNGSVLLKVAPDGKSVTPAWRSLGLEMHWSQPNLVNGHLYGFSGRNEPDAFFRCLEWETGDVLWQRYDGWPNGGHAKPAPGDKAPNVFGRGATIFADGRLIALGESGLLGLYEPSPKAVTELGRWQVPGLVYPCWAGPVLAEKKLYLRSEELLICLDWNK